MDKAEIVIKRKRKKGEDGHQYLSIRVKDETVTALDKMATESERSRNEIINIFIEYGIAHHKIENY